MLGHAPSHRPTEGKRPIAAATATQRAAAQPHAAPGATWGQLYSAMHRPPGPPPNQTGGYGGPTAAWATPHHSTTAHCGATASFFFSWRTGAGAWTPRPARVQLRQFCGARVGHGQWNLPLPHSNPYECAFRAGRRVSCARAVVRNGDPRKRPALLLPKHAR